MDKLKYRIRGMNGIGVPLADMVVEEYYRQTAYKRMMRMARQCLIHKTGAVWRLDEEGRDGDIITVPPVVGGNRYAAVLHMPDFSPEFKMLHAQTHVSARQEVAMLSRAVTLAVTPLSIDLIDDAGAAGWRIVARLVCGKWHTSDKESHNDFPLPYRIGYYDIGVD